MMIQQKDSPFFRVEKLELIKSDLEKLNDFYNGGRFVLNKKYIMQSSLEAYDHYSKRLESSSYSNLLKPIIDTFKSIITRKPPIITGLDIFDHNNVDNKGNNFHSFIKDICFEVILYGGVFISIRSDIEGTFIYLKKHSYYDLQNYQMTKNTLEKIVFLEKEEVPFGLFGNKVSKRYIVYKRDGGEIYVNTRGDNYVKSDEWVNTLNEVPVVFLKCGVERSVFEVFSRFNDIVYILKSILNLKSNLLFMSNIMCNPIPQIFKEGLINEVDPKEGEYRESRINFSYKNVFNFQDKGREGIAFSEIKGDGIDKIENRIQKMENDIHKITFSLLEEKSNRTIIDSMNNFSKNNGFFSDVSSEIESKMNNIIKIAYKTRGIVNNFKSEENNIELKKDFDNLILSDDKLNFFHNLLREGNLSLESFYKILKSNDFIDEDFDIEKELETIRKYE